MAASDIALDAKRTHAEISDDMLMHAALFIEDGDLVQASEKIWGALSHSVRQVAARRGWPLTENRDQKAVGAYIAQRLGDDALDSDMGALWEFHVNFYEDNENAATLEKGLERAREACAKLKAADGELSPDLPAPNGPLFREYQRRWENKGYPAVKPVEYTPDELRAYYARTLRRREKASDAVRRAREVLRRRNIPVPPRSRAPYP